MSNSTPQTEDLEKTAFEVAKELPDVPLIVIFKVLVVVQTLSKVPMTAPAESTKRLLRQKAVSDLTGMARPTLYEHMAKGLFPRPLKISRRFVCWPEGDVQAVITARIAGKSDDEIKALVDELTAARQLCA